MRRLNRKKAFNVVKELDAFTKVPEDYVKKSSRGGGLSLLSFSLILFLVISEFIYYTNTVYKYEYTVDKDVSTNLSINVDITVAMKCETLGSDVIDIANQVVETEKFLATEQAFFDLTPSQMSWLKARQDLLRDINEYRSLNKLIMLQSLPMPDGAPKGSHPTACRLHGTLTVNKVAGNFHITIGKHISDPMQRMGHRHVAGYVPLELYNLSHRIDHLSFGSPVPGMVNPLDATLQITETRQYLYQYYIQIVPTEYNTIWKTLRTNQYSVTERQRAPTAHKDIAIPGIFFKYDLSSILVKIREERRPFWHFIVRLCGIIGGIFATSGMIHTFIGLVTEYVQNCRKYSLLPKHLVGQEVHSQTSPVEQPDLSTSFTYGNQHMNYNNTTTTQPIS